MSCARRRRRKRFCRNLKCAMRQIAKAVRHLRCARELTCKVADEEELTCNIADLRAVCRELAALRRRRCSRSICGC